MGIGIVLHNALEYALNATDAPEWVIDFLEPISWGMPALIGVALAITSVRDVFRLAMVDLNDSEDSKGS